MYVVSKKHSFNHSGPVDFAEKFLTVIYTVSVTIKELFLQDFLVILKHSLQNYKNILKKWFPGTTWTVILSAVSNVEPHAGVLSVAKGSKILKKSFLFSWLVDQE